MTAATEPQLLCETRDSVATVTISNPAKRNAMTTAMWEAFPRLLAELAADPAVRVLVVQGDGATFCAGADIASLPELLTNAGPTSASVAEEALGAFAKPSIARVRGYCVGGGAQIAVACDFRFAADDAVFGVTPAKLGVVYQGAAVARLRNLVGLAPAKHLLFSAELVDAAYAARVGLVDRVVPGDELDAAVADYAGLLASRSQLSIQAAKSHLRALGDPAALALIDRSWQEEALRSGEVKEGTAAFAERRAAVFPWTGSGQVSAASTDARSR
jgi:enoyl-CoA hydratase/carnithine racemase